MRSYLLLTTILFGSLLGAQVYTVNSNDDVDDGMCDGIHCSLREAINAAEADGVASTIVFNIPGVGPHLIIPKDTFPNLKHPNLQIIGESQPGGLGSVVIDFSYRNFMSNSFWSIENENIIISGVSFQQFLYLDSLDHIFQIGKQNALTKNVSFYQCAFCKDNNFVPSFSKVAIDVISCDSFVFRKNIFGTDYLKSTIYNTEGYLKLDSTMRSKKAIIDSNIFVNKNTRISDAQLLILGGDVLIRGNLFGALDTNKAVNFLNADHGIDIRNNFDKVSIDNNFFFGDSSAILSYTKEDLEIINNRFYNIPRLCIVLEEGINVNINNNIARNSNIFLVNDNFRSKLILNVYDNMVENLGLFCLNYENDKTIAIKHYNNQILCVGSNPILNMVFTVFTNPPSITSVVKNEIQGVANAFDSISVYMNPRKGCPDADCRGGYEIGRTQADGFGKWVLSNIAFPKGASISAYAYNPNPNAIPNIYSEFSDCYQCTNKVIVNFNPSLCFGQTLTYRSKLYSESNPKDSIFVSGDGVSICDSIILVKLDYYSNLRTNLNGSVCYGDTLHFGAVLIHQNHLLDSLQLQSVAGCDSIVIISGKVVGVSNYTNSYCDSLSVKIGSTVFDKNNPSGIARIAGGATSGCDSVIFVNLTFNFSPETFINQALCPGQTLKVSGQIFDQNRPSGDVMLSNGSSTGCDSIVHVNVSYPNTTGFFSTSICSGDSTFIVNKYFSESNVNGAVTIPNGSSFGCDSIINVNLTIIPLVTHSINAQICRKDSIQVGTQFFSAKNTNGIVRFLNGSSNGCDSVVTITITINPSIQLDFDANDLKCNIANTGELILKDITGGSGNFKVSIDNRASVIYNQGDVIGNLAQGNHMIRIIDQQACDTTYTFAINNSQILSLQLPNDTTIKKGSIVDIFVNINFNQTNIKWDPDTFLICNTCLNTQSIPGQTITYTLTVTDENGCTISDNMTITVIVEQAEIFVPNSFSPNGDNINDIFMPVFKFPISTKINVFRIFDRWGNQIYEQLNGAVGETFGWNGTANGEKMEPGVYVYTIQFVGEDKVLKWKNGDVTLIR